MCQKTAHFTRARAASEKLLNGNDPGARFEEKVATAEADVKAFKTDLQRYKGLERSYAKQKAKDLKAADGE